MGQEQDAEEHLRVIRNLMERATIYRAISAPTALVGGLLSIVVSVFADEGNVARFVSSWLFALLLTLGANTWFIWRKAKREGGTIFSAGLRLAIWSALPAVLVASVLTAIIWDGGRAGHNSPLIATFWILFYALALLSTATFAPRSLILLGWCFLGTGVLGSLVAFELMPPSLNHSAELMMGLTFGVYHLIYAACTWPRKPVMANDQLAAE
jgi:hypothetical protein